MITVHKYLVGGPGSFGQLHLPKGFKLLTYRLQRGQHTIWVEVDNAEERKAPVTFAIIGTGHEVMPNVPFYCGTVEDQHGFIWHLYSDIAP